MTEHECTFIRLPYETEHVCSQCSRKKTMADYTHDTGMKRFTDDEINAELERRRTIKIQGEWIAQCAHNVGSYFRGSTLTKEQAALAETLILMEIRQVTKQ